MKKIIFLILLSVLCLSCGYTKEEKIAKLDGTEVEYSTLVDGPRTVIFMWTTWCPYCRTEFNKFMQNPSLLEGSKFVFANLDESNVKVESYLKGFKNADIARERVVIDKADVLSQKHNVIGIPTYLFFKDGELIDRLNFYDAAQVKKIFDGKQ